MPVGVLGLQTPSVRLVVLSLILTERDLSLFAFKADLTGLELGHAAGVEETGPQKDPE